MAIVINEFEAVAEAPPADTRTQENIESEALPIIEATDIQSALHVLQQQALRSWAH